MGISHTKENSSREEGMFINYYVGVGKKMSVHSCPRRQVAGVHLNSVV